MKTIIIPTDFSDNAWKAMCYAANLFHKTPCTFYLLNTYSFPYQYIEGGIVPHVDSLGEESSRLLNKSAENFKDLDHHDQSKFITVSKCDSLVNSIKRIEDSVVGDCLIIMGTRGVTGVGELLFGTMASSVIANAHSPVICVPNHAQLSTPKKIALAIDTDGINNADEVAPVLSLAENWKSSLSIVNILEKKLVLANESKERILIDHFLGDVDREYFTLPGKFKEDELTEFAKKNSIDLIAMIKRDRGFLQNLFHVSSTKNMAKYTNHPLLILRG